MVTVTMQEIMNFKDNGGIFIQAHLPLKGAYKMNKMVKSVDKEADFFIEKLQNIIEEYAKKDEEGNYVYSEDEESTILIQEDKVEECNQKLEELQGLEVEIENYNLTIDDLGDDIECSPQELEYLMPFLS